MAVLQSKQKPPRLVDAVAIAWTALSIAYLAVLLVQTLRIWLGNMTVPAGTPGGDALWIVVGFWWVIGVARLWAVGKLRGGGKAAWWLLVVTLAITAADALSPIGGLIPLVGHPVARAIKAGAALAAIGILVLPNCREWAWQTALDKRRQFISIPPQREADLPAWLDRTVPQPPSYAEPGSHAQPAPYGQPPSSNPPLPLPAQSVSQAPAAPSSWGTPAGVPAGATAGSSALALAPSSDPGRSALATQRLWSAMEEAEQGKISETETQDLSARVEIDSLWSRFGEDSGHGPA